MKIYRTQPPVVDRNVIELPWGYKILSVEPARNRVDGLIDMWFTVPNRERETVLGFSSDGEPVRIPATERVLVHIAGTGHDIPDDIDEDDYVGTCVMPSDLVWHVFARTGFDAPLGEQELDGIFAVITRATS